MTQKIKILLTGTVVVLVLAGVSFAPIAVADNSTLKPSDCPKTGVSEKGPNAGKACKKDPKDCSNDLNPKTSGVDPSNDTVCVALGSNTYCDNETGLCDKNPIVRNLNNIVTVLSALVGVVVVGNIILGGIQFAAAGDKADAVSAAKKRVVNGVIALVAYLFIFAFLQWLVPGGIF